jgi:hypothetical protein
LRFLCIGAESPFSANIMILPEIPEIMKCLSVEAMFCRLTFMLMSDCLAGRDQGLADFLIRVTHKISFQYRTFRVLGCEGSRVQVKNKCLKKKTCLNCLKPRTLDTQNPN